MKKLFNFVFVLMCFCLSFISLFLPLAFSSEPVRAENASIGGVYNTNEDEQETIYITCIIDENRTITLTEKKSTPFSLPTLEEYLTEDKYLYGWKDENGSIFSVTQRLVLGAEKTFTAMIEDKCVVKISSTKTEKYYVIPGEKFTLPEYKDEYNKNGFIVRGYKIDGKTYKAGDEIAINKDTTVKVKYVLTNQNIALICCLSAVVVAGAVTVVLVVRKRKIKKFQNANA